jgi:hypothetical protein
MDPAKYYGELVESIQDMELRQAARTLTFHVGENQAISLRDLAFAVLKCADDNALRKTRAILETLIEEHGFPVCSRSGKAGRWLPGTKEEALKAAKEREDRAVKLLASAKMLRAAKLPAGLPRIGADAQGRFSNGRLLDQIIHRGDR